MQEQLDGFAADTGLVGLALANEDGLLIAGSGTKVNMEIMAAISPIAKEKDRGRVKKIRTKLQERGLNFKIFDVKIGEQMLFLCATGEETQIKSSKLNSFLSALANQLISRNQVHC